MREEVPSKNKGAEEASKRRKAIKLHYQPKGDFPRQLNSDANANGAQDLWSQTVSVENQWGQDPSGNANAAEDSGLAMAPTAMPLALALNFHKVHNGATKTGKICRGGF
ncbi:hypothetical protein AMTR_s00055p00060420 [Amborella trichopoda]|uniref:Uncharacterized protein n=1 Tax=Amborella trichopoda TaxID=13333 RepID=U5CY06_AMBTC|nr:hypothetical protein AMTR_s00055p00060420 [Amborella trichopoda]